MRVSREHPRNEKGPISVSNDPGANESVSIELPEKQSGKSRTTEAGRMSDLNEEHPRSAKDSIQRSRDVDPKTNTRSRVHPLSEDSMSTSTESGTWNSVRDSKCERASRSRILSFDPGSNDKRSIELPEKQFGQSRETERGRGRVFNEEHPRNEKASIYFSRDEESNMICSRDEHPLKEVSDRVSINGGT
jgi:hypothetical protein